MDLKEWLRSGWLTEHQTSSQEIADLLGVIDRDTVQCQITGLSPDWQLNIAYNAVLQVATAALAAAGYRAAGEAQHYRVIESLAYTMNSMPSDCPIAKLSEETQHQRLRTRRRRLAAGGRRDGQPGQNSSQRVDGMARREPSELLVGKG